MGQGTFVPKYGSGIAVSPGASSAASVIDGDNWQVRIVNTGSNIAFVRTYSSKTSPEPVATAADYAIPPGMASIVSKAWGHDKIAYLSPAGTTLQIMTGEGF